eukprot:gi/632987842/ref/XP_007882780.1/ PREDICTED: zinc finger protein RFP-like [Callorhinchus milii]
MVWGAKLREAELRGTDLNGPKLRGAEQRGAELMEVELWRAEPMRAELCLSLQTAAGTEEPEIGNTCSICLEFYTDPLNISCGHNFCRDCILYCWGTGQESVSCPQCRQQILQRGVRPNRTLSNMVHCLTVFRD